MTLDLVEGRTVTLHFPASRQLPRGRDWLVSVPCPDDYRELVSQR